MADGASARRSERLTDRQARGSAAQSRELAPLPPLIQQIRSQRAVLEDCQTAVDKASQAVDKAAEGGDESHIDDLEQAAIAATTALDDAEIALDDLKAQRISPWWALLDMPNIVWAGITTSVTAQLDKMTLSGTQVSDRARIDRDAHRKKGLHGTSSHKGAATPGRFDELYYPREVRLWDFPTEVPHSRFLEPEVLVSKMSNTCGREESTIQLSSEAGVAKFFSRLIDLDINRSFMKEIVAEPEHSCYDPIGRTNRGIDLLCCTDGNTALAQGFLVIELKSCEKLLPYGFAGVTEDNFDESLTPGSNLDFAYPDELAQLSCYMINRKLKYGVLSSYAATWLVKLETPDLGHLVAHISRPFFVPVEQAYFDEHR
mmetsp:Transcript_20416/g.65204  ORF Transcript_20416/g.65204 Transcript_20416/m.65204 type:complete len:373 (+) Transcript_20416:565-1683(+)